MNTKELKQKISRWATGVATSGANGLELIDTSVQHMVETGDWTPISAMFRKLENTSDFATVRTIVGSMLEGARMKADPAHPEKYVFSKRKGETIRLSNKAAIVSAYIAEGASFRSRKLLDDLKPPQSNKKWDMDAYIKRVAKKAVDEGVETATFLEALRATIVEQKQAK